MSYLLLIVNFRECTTQYSQENENVTSSTPVICHTFYSLSSRLTRLLAILPVRDVWAEVTTPNEDLNIQRPRGDPGLQD